jgi:translation initiation factor IF-2
MAKVRVYDIAKELNLESKVLVPRLQAMGIDVKSHASSLEADEAEELIAKLREEKKANTVEKRISTGVIRRRTKVTRQKAKPAVSEEEEQKAEQEAMVEETKKPAKKPKEQKVEKVTAVAVEPKEKPVKPAKDEAPAEVPKKAEVAEAKKEENAPEEATTAEQALRPEDEVGAEAPKKIAEPEKKKPKKAKKDDSDFYRAKVIRRAPPPPPKPTEPAPVATEGQEAPAEQLPADAKPSGIRVLKVVPGKEGRGHQFIDMSKKDKAKRKPAAGGKHLKTEIQQQMFDAYSSTYTPGLSKRKRMSKRGGKKTQITTPKAAKRVIKLESKQILVSELAKRMGIKFKEVNKRLKDLGEEIESLRDDIVLDFDTATMVAQEFDHDLQDISFKEDVILESSDVSPTDLAHKPPVVTVMGHVDHGKTSILDAIRKTNVTDSESGGITQHIGAYEVTMPEGTITFIDTPGHEAFTAMRARGAGITDIVILVVAADDGVMPQTAEAIRHAQEAKVPIIVAANKIDLPSANVDRIKQGLAEFQLVPEEWGGDTPIVEVSAKTKVGLEDLLENVLLQAEMLELKANPKKKATGTVIEARLDRGRGPVATLLVLDGTLHKGDVAVVGTTYGKVRTLFDYTGKSVKDVHPGRPVQVQGLGEVPQAGDSFHIVKNEREAKKIMQHRKEQSLASRQTQTAKLNLEDFYERLQGKEKLELKVVVKADVQGTAEAVKQALEKLSVPQVSVKVIFHGVGGISETDVNLASASEAVLVGFNTRPDPNAKKLAQTRGIDIRTYKVIYDLTEDIRRAQTGLLPKTTKENVLGHAEVRELFTVPKIGTIAGVSVQDGKIIRSAMVRLLRDSVEVHTGHMSSLKRFKEDVREVASGYECGIGIENFNDIKRGDVIEVFELQEEQPTL